MIALILLTLLAAWIAWDYSREWRERSAEDKRRERKAALRREYLTRAPESPSAYEMLGDAMREAGDLDEAVACYEEALALRQKHGGGEYDGVAGRALPNKLRLVRFEIAQNADPAEHGQTLQTRQQVCRVCGNLSGPQDHACVHCGRPLPVDAFLDTLRRKGLRSEIREEMTSLLGKCALVAVAMLCASFLPWEVRGAVIIAAVIVIPIRLLKSIGPDG